MLAGDLTEPLRQAPVEYPILWNTVEKPLKKSFVGEKTAPAPDPSLRFSAGEVESLRAT
jgi:hypothetical protein